MWTEIKRQWGHSTCSVSMGCKMAPCVGMLVARCSNLHLTLGTCVMEGENGLLQVVSTRACTYSEDDVENPYYHHYY